jgi:hypothetical protein
MTGILPAGAAEQTAMVDGNRVFLLSPARCDGRRAKILLNERATFDLASRLRTEGATIGDVFAFLSKLYFRGKLAYARAFGRRSDGGHSSFVITTDRGLIPPDTVLTRADVERFATVDIASGDDRYRAPLRESATRLDTELRGAESVVLLGSIATGKYVDTLLEVFGDRLLFPVDFVGRGDMSRGGLLLRSAREGRELPYVAVRGAIRHGKRPPKLDAPRRRD